jgi:hypothetical protein
MSGAVESGLRAAIEVMDEIRPQCLSAQDYALIKDVRNYGTKRSQGSNSDSAEVAYSVLRYPFLLIPHL